MSSDGRPHQVLGSLCIGSWHTWAKPGREEHVGHRHSVKVPHVCFPPALGGQRCCEHRTGQRGGAWSGLRLTRLHLG